MWINEAMGRIGAAIGGAVQSVGTAVARGAATPGVRGAGVKVAAITAAVAGVGLLGTAALMHPGIIGFERPFEPMGTDAARSGAQDVQSREAGRRAIDAWNSLNATTGQPNGGLPSPQGTGLYRGTTSGKDPWTGSVWSHSQVHAGALNLAAITGDTGIVDTLDRQMQNFLWEGGYQPQINPIPIYDPRGHEHYSDDNMAIGLNYVQQYDQTGDPAALDKAEKLLDFLMTMEDGTGLNWRTGSTAYVADSITGGQKLALLVAERVPERRDAAIAFARRLEQFQEQHLRVREGEREGLVRDNVMSNNETAGWSENIFSYNEGWTIGADIEWYKLTGEQKYLDRARHTADRTLEFYEKHDKDGLWRQPASFNANFFENLLALDRIDPPKEGEQRPYDYEKVFGDYLDRAWNEARDPETGYFDRNGFGLYGIDAKDRGPKIMTSIDQGAMVQMYALRAMTDEQRARVA